MSQDNKPACPQMSPYVIQEKAGKKMWCSCGQSKKQPYCDGSHSGTDFFPEIVHLDQDRLVAW